MVKFLATIQAEHEAERMMPSLTKGLQQVAADLFFENVEETIVRWKIIPKGFAWTAGKPSRSTVLMCMVPKGITFETRTNFMRHVNDFWVKQTGADPNELLIFTVNAKSASRK